MRKSLTVAKVALLALLLVALVTAAWAGFPAVVAPAPVELVGFVAAQTVAFVSRVVVSLYRPTAAALLRGPPSSGLVPRTTRTLDQESAWPENGDSPRSSPT